MKIVCMTNNIEDLVDWDRDHFGKKLAHLTKGKTYDGMNINDASNPFKDPKKLASPFDVDIMIVDDSGGQEWYPYYLFEPLYKLRDEVINKILEN